MTVLTEKAGKKKKKSEPLNMTNTAMQRTLENKML